MTGRLTMKQISLPQGITRKPSVAIQVMPGCGHSDRWHIQIILGEELNETGGDGRGIPARQVVARTRYRHRVDFWNPLLQ